MIKLFKNLKIHFQINIETKAYQPNPDNSGNLSNGKFFNIVINKYYWKFKDPKEAMVPNNRPSRIKYTKPSLGFIKIGDKDINPNNVFIITDNFTDTNNNYHIYLDKSIERFLFQWWNKKTFLQRNLFNVFTLLTGISIIIIEIIKLLK